MPEYDNTNRFYLKKTEVKRDEKDNDWSGTVNIDGKDYWLNGYVNRDGSISGPVKEKKPKPNYDKPVTTEDLPDWLK